MVKLVVVQNFLVGTYQKPTQQILVLATDPQSDWLDPESDVRVTQADIDAMYKTRTGALASVELVKIYGWKIGDPPNFPGLISCGSGFSPTSSLHATSPPPVPA